MGSTLHILVVDDRPDSVLFLTEFLLSRRHRVETCNHGSEALEAIVRRNRTADAYDLLISDVSMPGMDGITLLKEIRRRQMLLPVALYTAYGAMHPTLAQQAQQHGCLAVLDKPIELRRVESLVEEVLAKRSGTTRVESDQPFFGTSRVVRSPESTTAHRRETSQPADMEVPASGGYALEPKPVIPMPPAPLQPRTSYTSVPLPPPPPPRIPPPIRTPLPFPIEAAEPQTRSMPSFRTPVPPTSPHPTTNRSMNPAFRTPLPFLQPGATMSPAIPPVIPPNVAAAPPVRTVRTPQPPVLPSVVPGSEETDAPPHKTMAANPTTSFIRRGVNPQTKGFARPNTDAQVNQIGTSRIRRTVTGSYAPSPLAQGQVNQQARPANNGATRAVACAHCQKVFMVASRAESYTAVCVHCGQLNRIDPL